MGPRFPFRLHLLEGGEVEAELIGSCDLLCGGFDLQGAIAGDAVE
jgi:hypothetical protein